jgi:hypothetical protein
MLVLGLGCGSSNRGAVKGKVTVNGEPLQEGQLSFVPLDPGLGPSAGAGIINGEYKIDAAKGPLAGEYRVQINAFRKTGKKTWDGMGDEQGPAGKKNFVEEVEAFIPPKYNTASELRATIKAGEVNVYDFDLEIAAKK